MTGTGDTRFPYAIREPYEIDENLSEPSWGLRQDGIQGLRRGGAPDGIRVVWIRFRTAAKDADWVRNTRWMYWIKERSRRAICSSGRVTVWFPLFIRRSWTDSRT